METLLLELIYDYIEKKTANLVNYISIIIKADINLC